ncbi:MAG TPA: OB-fold domain-containing protein [Acidimicrobiia bacterium]
MEPTAPAAPMPDSESAPFWEALGDHRLVLQRCPACGRHRFPPMPACPWCGERGAEPVEATGGGEVYSWVTVHRALGPGFAGDAPYTIATVTLTEGCRVFARLDHEAAGGTEVVRAGLPVRARFVDHDGWTELRFAPVGAGR